MVLRFPHLAISRNDFSIEYPINAKMSTYVKASSWF